MDKPANQNDSRFQDLLARGLSRDKAARILAAEAGGEPETYEDWTDEELMAHATGLAIEDAGTMTRAELIVALRNR